MRGFLIFLGLLLVLGGGAVAGAQFAPVDLSMLDSVAGAREFLGSQTALYAGGGTAGFGLLLIIIGAATGGKKKQKPARAEAARADTSFDQKPAPKPVTTLKPAPAPQPAPVTQPMAATPRPAPQPAPQPALQPVAAAPRPAPLAPKPTASAQPPASVQEQAELAPGLRTDPRMMNRTRVKDLVTINDALKAYHARHGAYPKAASLGSFVDRGAAWIPGLSPDFLAELPRDPALSIERNGPQYTYVSNGTDYKLLATGVSLVGGHNVEVLGVRIDASKQPTAENASFGFWTAGFADA